MASTIPDPQARTTPDPDPQQRPDRPDHTAGIETHGIDHIPDEERHGRPRELFGVWAAPSVNYLSLAIGGALGLFAWRILQLRSMIGGWAIPSARDPAHVAATVQNGWAVAWWPGAHHLASAQLTTPSGTRTQTFPLYPCDVHNCHGGPHGGAPSGGPGGG